VLHDLHQWLERGAFQRVVALDRRSAAPLRGEQPAVAEIAVVGNRQDVAARRRCGGSWCRPGHHSTRSRRRR
jgi:hypothetical protein